MNCAKSDLLRLIFLSAGAVGATAGGLLVLGLWPINFNWQFLQKIIDRRFIWYPTDVKNISDNNDGMCIYIVDIANICVECNQKPQGILKDYQ